MFDGFAILLIYLLKIENTGVESYIVKCRISNPLKEVNVTFEEKWVLLAYLYLVFTGEGVVMELIS